MKHIQDKYIKTDTLVIMDHGTVAVNLNSATKQRELWKWLTYVIKRILSLL